MQLLQDLSKEIERLKLEHRTPALPTTSPEALRLEELHEEMSQLRSQNATLQEANEELQASLLHAGLETGRILTNDENSLAHELDVMSRDEVCIIGAWRAWPYLQKNLLLFRFKMVSDSQY